MPHQFSSVSAHRESFPPMASHQRMRVFYSGRVQGVGFRYTVKNIAMQYDVSGYVRNLSDGRVELIMEGPASDLDQMLQSIRQRMAGYIRNIDTDTVPATGEFSHFHIRH